MTGPEPTDSHTPPAWTHYSEFVGVYDADGGVVGEVRYVVGHLLGRTECALCDITHSPLRRKPEWDRWVGGLGVGFRLLHRNELDRDLAAVVAVTGAPVVVGRLGHEWRPVLDPAALGRLDGSVPAFAAALRAAAGA